MAVVVHCLDAVDERQQARVWSGLSCGFSQESDDGHTEASEEPPSGITAAISGHRLSVTIDVYGTPRVAGDLVEGGLLEPVDHHDLHRAAGALDLQPELFLHFGREAGGNRIDGRGWCTRRESEGSR